MASSSQQIQKQLEKLTKMLQDGGGGVDKSTAAKDDIAIILQEDAAAPTAAAAADAELPMCNCSKNTELLQKLCKEVRRIHELLEKIEERKPEVEDLASRAERLARADAALAVFANTATAQEVPLAEALVAPAACAVPEPMTAPPAPPQPAFVVREAAPAVPAAMAPMASGTTTFEEVSRTVAEGDVETLRRMLNDTWRERTKSLYSPEQLAEEPTEPPSAMDVFRDSTAELAQDLNVTSKHEFLDRLRLILKQTAPGILASLPQNPHAYAVMRDLWGPEWIV
jgi:hypothetical protein